MLHRWLQAVAEHTGGAVLLAAILIARVSRGTQGSHVRLALASNYTPDRRPLSEYGFHLAGGLRNAASSDELVILSGRFPTTHAADVFRVWDAGSPHIPLQIMAALRQHAADAVLFNTHFTTWGSNLGNLAGLVTPWLAKRAGLLVATLLHHLPQTIDVRRVGYRLTPAHRLAIELGCRAIAASDVVCFTLKRDQDFFTRRFAPARTLYVPHGVLGRPRWCPPPGSGTVLAFGHWGRGKDPEPLLRAGARAGDLPRKVIVAGPSSHTRPGFVEQLAQRYASPRTAFPGYVLESDVPDLFHSADLVVLPYNENTGASGVLYQTCQFGRVPLLRRLPVFEEMVEDLGLAAHFYDSEEDLAVSMRSLLSEPDRLLIEGRHNFEAIHAFGMDRIGQIYWRLFDQRG